MERKFKHKLTNKVIKIGGKTGLSCQTLIGNSNLILGDIIKGEDWQEIIEKDYEILSLISTKKDKTIITYQNGGGIYSEDFFPNVYKSIDHWVKCFLSNNNPWQIYSVKRLSDGEVFTIGDKLQPDKGEDGYLLLEKIDNNNANLWGHYINNSNGLDEFGRTLKYVEKLKQPLFTTEDGIDIFEGDYYYPVEKLYYFLHEKQTNNHCTNEEKFWIFSTKEKAEEYIFYNKPCLSLNDINNMETKSKVSTFFMNDLEKLIKSKL
jgi:hypothetical protein